MGNNFKGFDRDWLQKTGHEKELKEIFGGGSSSKERSCATDSQNKPQMAKYGNKKVQTPEGTFDSKKEYGRWLELKQMQREEKIFELGRQRVFEIVVNGHVICDYISDFDYWSDGKQYVEDVKSSITRKLPVYRLKKKLLKAIWNIDINEV